MGMIESIVAVEVAGRLFFGVAVLVDMPMFFRGRRKLGMTGFLRERQRNSLGSRMPERSRQYGCEKSHQQISAQIKAMDLPQGSRLL